MTSLDLILVYVQRLLFLISQLLLLKHLFDLKLLMDHPQLLVVLTLLFSLKVLKKVVLLNLTVTDEFLILDEALDLLALLSLLSCQVILILADDFEVVKVRPFRILLCHAMVSHLLLKVLPHSCLIITNLGLDSILFFLELLNIMHYNLGPIVRVL